MAAKKGAILAAKWSLAREPFPLVGQEGKASEPSVKGGSAKMAPSRGALNTQLLALP